MFIYLQFIMYIRVKWNYIYTSLNRIWMSREKIIEETKPFINNARSLIIIICHGKMPQLYTTLTHKQQKKDVNV